MSIPLAAVFVVLVLWAPTYYRLSSDWLLTERYQFGWLVPGLALLLFHGRLADLPLPGGQARRRLGFCTIVCALALLCLAFPVWEANPEWRLLGLFSAAVSAVGTLGVIGSLGGAPWVRHFLFPALFGIAAVPWLRPIESALVNGLAAFNASAVVELLQWSAIEAMQRGTIVDLATGPVGVADACSGMRSLQTALVGGLFLGEFLRLNGGYRLMLLFAAIGTSFVTNFTRLAFLCWYSALESPSEAYHHHDAAGLVAAVVLSLLVLHFARKGSRRPVSTGVVSIRFSVNGSTIGWRVAAGCAAILVATAGATEAWFHHKEQNLHPQIQWDINLPHDAAGFEPTPLGEQAASDLRCDFYRGAHWVSDSGARWQAAFMLWKPGRNSLQLAHLHHPAICLSASGLVLREKLPPLRFQAGDFSLVVEHYVFDSQRGRMDVFNAVTDDIEPERPHTSAITDNSLAGRLRNTFEGRRHQGQRRLILAVGGSDDDGLARQRALGFLSDRLVIPARSPHADKPLSTAHP